MATFPIISKNEKAQPPLSFGLVFDTTVINWSADLRAGYETKGELLRRKSTETFKSPGKEFKIISLSHRKPVGSRENRGDWFSSLVLDKELTSYIFRHIA